MKIYILILSLFVFIGGCRQASQKGDQINMTNASSIDSMKTYRGINDIDTFTINDFELYNTHIKGDSLEIDGSSTFIFLPFGEFNNVSSFSAKYKNLKFEASSSSVYEDASYTIDLFRFSSKNSYVKFLLDRVSDLAEDPTERLEIVYAKIVDDEIPLAYNIKVGMTRVEFLKKITTKIDSLNLESINVYELMVDGIWHYYTFKNDILTSIILDTDYQVDKD